jgi:predicted dehydrogenase
MIDVSELVQTLDLPAEVRPVVIFGAGSIVVDAHLPAYAALGVPIAGIYDPNMAKAAAVLSGVSSDSKSVAFETIEQATTRSDVIYDLAVPPAALPAILKTLPVGVTVILQKPMGANLDEASEILQICRARKLNAAVNFQLRFAPMMLALKDAIARGALGDIVDIDASMVLDTPWHLWKFLADLPRVEILLHSIHYLDFIRDVLGNPQGVHATTMGHPSSSISNTRSAMILDYGTRARCNLSVNHNHSFGRKFQRCEFIIGGTKGAAHVKMGVNLDYPRGEPDTLWINQGGDWQEVPLTGNWFIDAFKGRFAQVQRFAAGLDPALQGSVEDAWRTMALVEAAYESAALPAHKIKGMPDA